MNYQTVGRVYETGKIAPVVCVENDRLRDIYIKDQAFLLVVLTEGSLTFEVAGERVMANAPSFICFDERANPRRIGRKKATCHAIYFHPQFLNVNMTFPMLHADVWGDLAQKHDMFLLKPFLDGQYTVPIVPSYVEKVTEACREMARELTEQRDWYWSCRGRSYFMEVLIALERMYGLLGHSPAQPADTSITVSDRRLREAVLYIESHFADPLTLRDIVQQSGLNHTTLTTLMKATTGQTAMEYLMSFRVAVAKKQLAFTSVPIKDVSLRCGFKTVQHFNRIFKEHTGQTPARFRVEAVETRKREIK
ncbi:MAG: helix-turn-helix transcriptional regulator [Clostridia bacterium]|nr:helix-turn-helix transcriptional regulator [Clostridia bacterium]